MGKSYRYCFSAIVVCLAVALSAIGCENIFNNKASHTITFDANNGSGSTATQTAVSGDTITLLENTFVSKGHGFSGWSTSANGSVLYTDKSSYLMGSSDVTLYAIWSTLTYSIAFDANGGSGSMSAQSLKSGATEILTANAFYRTGYSFEGWATSASGTVAYFDKASYTMGSANVVLYAIWSTNLSYSISFNANGGSGSIASVAAVSGSTIKLPANSFTNSGYYFSGWATTSSGSIVYADQASYTVGTSNAVLYAIWSAVPTYSVTFIPNGGSGTMPPQVITSGTTFTINANTFTRGGYSFSGWALSASGAVVYADKASYTMGTTSLALYAIWISNPSHTITFNSNDGSGAVSSQSIPSGATVVLNANTFANGSYSFGGWATTSSGAATYSDQANYTMGASDVTLYAIWVSLITFDSNGGSGVMPAQSVIIGVASTLCENLFTLSGYNFIGWTTSTAGTGISYANKTTITPVGSCVLYAIWLPATMTYSSSGNSIRITGFSTAPAGAFSIPAGVTQISDNAFRNSSELTSVAIPSSVTAIGQNAFQYCTNLTSVIIPSSVSSIGGSAFANCSKLTNVVIQSGVSSIGNCAFASCGYSTITIPDSVTSIGEEAFYACTKLTTINVDSHNLNYCSSSGILFSKDMTALFEAPGAFAGSYTIPDSVTTIGKFAFQACEGLVSVVLPENLTTLGIQAFLGCTGLTSIVIPPKITSCSGFVFEGCKNLTDVTFSSGVSTIWTCAFAYDTALKTISIPSSVSSIESQSFIGCTALSTISIYATTPPTLGSSAFKNIGSSYSIHIPSGTDSYGNTYLYNYQNATNWSTYAANMVSP
jgi:uncharacterized repeat protein (TIGR02543 family)